MNPANPEATHVAVREGRILGAGTLEELAGWGDYELDDRFADKVLMPGFVEGHSHAREGIAWRGVYCGNFERMDPDGKVWDGMKFLNAIVERLKERVRALDDPSAPVSGWSFDPIYYGDRKWGRVDLDAVSTTRPIGVHHTSGHIIYVNTKALMDRLSAQALGLIRVKGFVQSSDGRFCAVQSVGRRWTVSETSPTGEEKGRIVCITHMPPIDSQAISRIINKLD